MAEPKRQKPIWYLVGCIGLALLCIPCVGILAAIAIPAFVRFTRASKTAEARANVHAIAIGIESYCMADRFPPTSSVLPDAVGPSLTHPDATRQAQDFSAPGWVAVGFGPSEPLYYAYSIERPDASSARVVAEGDLDGDGERSRYEITCTAAPGSCSCGELVVTNELE